jgi:hypothetical protein
MIYYYYLLIIRSGKTLSFLIPMFELLWREKITQEAGLVAIILTPTRELAVQIFEVLLLFYYDTMLLVLLKEFIILKNDCLSSLTSLGIKSDWKIS